MSGMVVTTRILEDWNHETGIRGENFMKTKWQGVFAAAATQFNSDLSLDLAATAGHIEVMIEAGVHGLIVLGTSGENTSHEPDEKHRVLEMAVRMARGRVPVLAGIAEFTTAAACRYAADAERLGLDGLMLLPAMVYKADPREAVAHFRAVARASRLPILVYNNPGTYGVDITPAMLAELADEKTLVAIKESSGDVRRVTEIKRLLGNRYTVFCGADTVVLECLLAGANGWVSGLHNAFPREARLLWDLLQSGQRATALEVYRWWLPLLQVDTSPKYVQAIKLLTAQAGLGSERVRPPRMMLAGDERKTVLGLARQALAMRPRISKKR
jgi:4-hydroxy-tetrahydrodipicolinate synthase